MRARHSSRTVERPCWDSLPHARCEVTRTVEDDRAPPYPCMPRAPAPLTDAGRRSTPRARARRAHRFRRGGWLTFDRMSTAPSGLAPPGAPDGGGGAGGRRGPFARGHEKRQPRGAGRGPGGKKTRERGRDPRRPNAAQAGTPRPPTGAPQGPGRAPDNRAEGARGAPTATSTARGRAANAAGGGRAEGPHGARGNDRLPRSGPSRGARPRAPKGARSGAKGDRPKGRARAATTERRGRREAPQAHSRAPERRSAGRKAEHEGPQRGPSGARGRAPELPGTAAVHDLILGQYSVRHDGIRRSDYAREAAWQVSEKFGFIRTEAMIS